MKILVLGLGNPILADDGVGIYIARELQKRSLPKEVVVEESSLSGFYLMDLLLGYDKAIIIDSVKTKGGKVGEIYSFKPEVFDRSVHLTSVHQTNLATAMKFGKQIGLKVPKEIIIFAVEIADNQTFSEECTPLVQKAIPRAVRLVEEELLSMARG